MFCCFEISYNAVRDVSQYENPEASYDFCQICFECSVNIIAAGKKNP